MKYLLSVVVSLFILCIPNFAQVKNTENTLKLTEGQTSEKATIGDAAWLAGSWGGTG